MVTPKINPTTTNVGKEMDKEQKRLWCACQEFESALINYLIRQMWQAYESFGSNEHSFIFSSYRDMFTFEVAKNIAITADLGIAETIYRQLNETTSKRQTTGEKLSIKNERR